MILAYFDESGKIYYAKYLKEATPALNDMAMKAILEIPELIPAKNYDGIPIKSELHFLVKFDPIFHGRYGYSYY